MQILIKKLVFILVEKKQAILTGCPTTLEQKR